MKDNLIIPIKKYPLFLFLLPVFFVLHGFTENYDFVPVKDAALLTGIYIIASTLLLFTGRLFYKSWVKASLLAFFLVAIHFFFGSIHDGLRNIFPGSFITRYVFILPLILLLIILIAFLLKKRKKPLQQWVYYLNILFFLLVIIDIVVLSGKIANHKKNEPKLSNAFIPCTTCNYPDVYLIITDEYAGNMQLKDIFGFDNTPFLNQLAGRGFHIIPNSSSNYDLTPYSIASILDLDYFHPGNAGKKPLLTYAYETIRNNQLLKFFQSHQYQFYNYSLFDFNDQPAYARETFLPVKTKLITSQTFLNRLEKEMRYHLAVTIKSKSEIRRNAYYTQKNNEKLFQLTTGIAGEKTRHPKFVLTHLMMPHYPYYYDKEGREFPLETLTEGNQKNQQHYIEYLQYSNKKILELVDHILKNSSAPPVVILLGDHGFRHFDNPVDPRYYFSNLAAVSLPGKNYSAFADTLTNVNFIRTVLNTSFRQQLPYLKDTAIIMDNP